MPANPHLAGPVDVADEGFHPVLVVGVRPRRTKVGQHRRYVDDIRVVEVLQSTVVCRNNERPAQTKGKAGTGPREKVVGV